MTTERSDTSQRGDIQTHLLSLLPQDAVEWLMMLWDATQVFDDYADGDPVTKESLYKTIWDTLVAMPSNRFYLLNHQVLSPIVALMVIKWRGANVAELIGNANEKSYMWRAEYYGVVLMCCNICHGAEATSRDADKILNLYGETFEEYMKEFKTCQSP